MELAHALHLARIPDGLERLFTDVSYRLAIQHVALAARIDVARLFHVHRPAPEVVARVFPFARGVSRVRPHQVGLVFFDAYLIDAGNLRPEAHEVFDLARVALHTHHLDYHLHLCATLVFHSRETHEVVAHFFETRTFAVIFKAF